MTVGLSSIYVSLVLEVQARGLVSKAGEGWSTFEAGGFVLEAGGSRLSVGVRT